MARSQTSSLASPSIHLHQGQPVVTAGTTLKEARAAAVMLHGRGATAQGILALADEMGQPDFAYLAPQAHGLSWYPHSFLAPLRQNEPALSSALRAVADVVKHIQNVGLTADRIVIIGFSQGACLGLEFAARHATRFGGVAALSGGLIGTSDIAGARPPGDKLFEYPGNLSGTPVFVGCSDIDPHIPLARIQTSVDTLRRLGGTVTDRIYPGMEHTVNEDELNHVRQILSNVLQTGPVPS